MEFYWYFIGILSISGATLVVYQVCRAEFMEFKVFGVK